MSVVPHPIKSVAIIPVHRRVDIRRNVFITLITALRQPNSSRQANAPFVLFILIQNSNKWPGVVRSVADYKTP